MDESSADARTEPDLYDGPERRRAVGADVAAELLRIDGRLNRGAQRMDDMQAELSRNTLVTTEVRDLLQVARAGLRVLGAIGQAARWVGGLAGAAVAIWGLWQAIRHGTPPPKP